MRNATEDSLARQVRLLSGALIDLHEASVETLVRELLTETRRHHA